MLLITASTGDELLRNVNIDDLEWPWTPQIRSFGEFFAILDCDAHFNSELHRDGRRQTKTTYAYEFFSIGRRF